MRGEGVRSEGVRGFISVSCLWNNSGGSTLCVSVSGGRMSSTGRCTHLDGEVVGCRVSPVLGCAALPVGDSDKVCSHCPLSCVRFFSSCVRDAD